MDNLCAPGGAARTSKRERRGTYMEPFWQIGQTRVWEQSRRVEWDQNRASLSPQQHQLLMFLLTHQQEVVTRQQLMELFWPSDPANEHRLYTLLSDLRKKLGQRELIRTISRSGYTLTLAAKRTDPTSATPSTSHGSSSPVDRRPSADLWEMRLREAQDRWRKSLGIKSMVSGIVRLFPTPFHIHIDTTHEKWRVRILNPKGQLIGEISL